VPDVLSIVHEDDCLLVVNKPAGLVCHPTKDGPLSSLVGRVRLHLGTAEGRLVNRLDRETSGLVLVAKGAAVAGELGRLIAGDAAGRVSKTYWAIVDGHVPDATRVITAPLGKDEDSPVAIKDRVREDGAAAETEVRLLRAFTRDARPYSFVEVTPRTGRKHQIRIHLAHIGHPIVGDKLYGDDERWYLRFVEGRLTAGDRAALRLTFHALHARSLSFDWRGRHWAFQAELEDEFCSFLAE